MRYFLKIEVANTPFMAGLRGLRATWEPTWDGNGVLATADEKVVSILQPLAKAGRAGVVEITKDQYEELKKKAEERAQSQPRSSPVSPVRPSGQVVNVLNPALFMGRAPESRVPAGHRSGPAVEAGKPAEIGEEIALGQPAKRTNRPNGAL